MLDANTLAQRYSTSQAHHRALHEQSLNEGLDGIPRGPDWDAPRTEDIDGITLLDTAVKSKQKQPRLFQEDWALANSIIFLRDGILFLEVVRAIALGDIGRAWEVFKVVSYIPQQRGASLTMPLFQVWIFTFAGSGNSHYAGYLVEMYCNLEHEYPKVTRDALLNNWLVNTQGKPGHFLEMDLMQEHFNHWLEELAQHKGKEFDDEWYREVLSMHVHHFLRLIQEFETNVHLTPRSKRHGEPHLDNELHEVINLCRKWDLHIRCNGRDFGFHSVDNFDQGYLKLAAEGKLEQYIAKTMEEWENKSTEIPMPEGYEDASTYLQVPITCEDGQVEI